MHSLSKAKTTLTSLLVGVAAALSGELRSAAPTLISLIPHWATLVLSIGLAAAIGNTLPHFLFKSQWIRKRLEGRSWIEGHWEILTEPNSQNERPIARGILQYSYVGSQLELQAQAWHLYEDGTEAHSISQIIDLRSSDLQYVNIFIRSEHGLQVTGAATGHFQVDKAVAPHPTTYTGRLSFFDTRPTKAQKLKKLPDALVKQYAIKYGLGWKRQYLLEQSNLLHSHQNAA